MRRASVVTAVAGLALGLLVSVAAWVYLDTFALFLFVPFVPFLFRRRGGQRVDAEPSIRRCPQCGFQTRNDAFEFCPRDGARLELARPGDQT